MFSTVDWVRSVGIVVLSSATLGPSPGPPPVEGGGSVELGACVLRDTCTELGEACVGLGGACVVLGGAGVVLGGACVVLGEACVALGGAGVTLGGPRPVFVDVFGVGEDPSVGGGHGRGGGGT